MQAHELPTIEYHENALQNKEAMPLAGPQPPVNEAPVWTVS
jgi:hypothetical protein